MNCEKSQQYILLRQSGELTAADAAELGKHLDGCAACRGYAGSAGKIAAAASSAAVDGPSASVMAAIRAAARTELDNRTILFPVPVVRWLAYAAAAVLIFGGVFTWTRGSRPEHRASQVSAIVLAVGSEDNLNVVSQSGRTEKDQELQALASHLLLMEGFGVEETPEVELIDAGDEPLPTALRSHSTGASDLQRCV